MVVPKPLGYQNYKGGIRDIAAPKKNAHETKLLNQILRERIRRIACCVFDPKAHLVCFRIEFAKSVEVHLYELLQ